MRAQPGANLAKHFAVVVRSRISNRVRQIDDRCAGFNRRQNNLAKIVDIRAAGVFGGKFDFVAVLPAEPHHFRDLFERLLARGAQFVFQVQVRSGEENVQAGFCGRLETAQRRFYVLLARAGQSRYAAIA